MIAFAPLTPWTVDVRRQVFDVAADMADMDALEIFGLRQRGDGPEDIVADIARIIIDQRMIDGMIALRQIDGQTVPVAVALAFQSSLPNVADLAMFGRKNHARAMPAIYRELFTRSLTFGARYRIAMAQVPVLGVHRAARRILRSLGGQEAFNYGPIGLYQQPYIHTIWRF